ncbi:RNase H domain-containing protein [Caerostris darwini]|uniref:RNase H domain-containing protein n=1 Tax=Caerostris darwini TaxID=1538125 RepID=A0AAV4RU49_9ARAC|nr:RNase H domain-containing protein [Caerostris darwini]
MSGRVIFENSQDPNLDMQSHNFTFTIVNIYAPHGFDIKQVQKIFSNLKTQTFIFGDFNLHHPFWGGKTSTPKSDEFLDWLNPSHFSILNTSTPTHITHNFTSSVIDLTLCSAALLNEVYCYVSECTFVSDHLPIVVSWSKLTNATKYLKTIYWNPILRDSNKFLQSIVDPTVEIVTEKISRTININTKNKILANNEYPPWWNIACNNFCQLKKIMWKKARNSVSVPDWIRYKKYRTEVLAICIAIDELAIVDKDILIISDSFLALNSHKNINIHSTYVIQTYFKTFNQNITLLWVPGMGSGILWNEKADFLAKNTTELSQFIEWISPEDVIANLKKQSYLILETNYFNSNYYDLIGNFPDIGTITKWTQNRRQDILIARIISRMIVTPALLNRFNLDSYPFSSICNETNDLLHILLRCRKYSTSRLHLWQNLNIDENTITFKAFLSKILDCKKNLTLFLQSLKLFGIY